MAVDAQSNFLIFRQRKYAIPGLTLSPVGGFIEIGESPYDAARREVREELGVGSRRGVAAEAEAREEARAEKEEDYGSTKEGWWAEEGENDHNDDDDDPPDGGVTDGDPDWTYLGVYRTAANRGGGFLHSYLLRNAMPIGTGEKGGTESYLGTGDDERQDLVRMTREEISDAVMGGEFKEIKWAATVALAMMHLNRLDASFPALGDVVDVIVG